MIVYEGHRTGEGAQVERKVRKGEDWETASLPPRLDLSYHSPSGLEWGYGGSGPAQLALALLADALQDDERAMRIYQRFKWEVIAGLTESDWQLTAQQIQELAAGIESR